MGLWTTYSNWSCPYPWKVSATRWLLRDFSSWNYSVIFLDADQGCVLTCNSYLERGGTVVGKSREWTWRCGGERAVRTEALTLSITITEAGKRRASSSLHPLDHSVQNALKLLSFCVLTTAAPLWQNPSPVVTHTVLLLSKGAGELLLCLGVFGDELSQYHSADTWLLNVNNCFLFCEHSYEYCISVYFSI